MDGFLNKPSKFMSFGENYEQVPHDYGNLFFRQPVGNVDRLVIGPSRRHLDLLLELAKATQSREFYMLYVLLEPTSGAPQGRYESPIFDSFAQLESFCLRHREYLEGDGRHHVWVGTTNQSGQLIYDQHNVIFAYGRLAAYEHILLSKGYLNQDFWFPMPHIHGYPATPDQEREFLQVLPWYHFPLQEADQW